VTLTLDENEEEMFMYRLIAIAVALTLTVGCGAPKNSDDSEESITSHHAAKDNSSAGLIVKKYVKDNNIDVAGLEPAFARKVDATGKDTSLPAGFGSELWVVRYAPVRKEGEEITLGGGILFWVDAASGKVQVKRERIKQ
jgi:hypothetical protein